MRWFSASDWPQLFTAYCLCSGRSIQIELITLSVWNFKVRFCSISYYHSWYWLNNDLTRIFWILNTGRFLFFRPYASAFSFELCYRASQYQFISLYSSTNKPFFVSCFEKFVFRVLYSSLSIMHMFDLGAEDIIYTHCHLIDLSSFKTMLTFMRQNKTYPPCGKHAQTVPELWGSTVTSHRNIFQFCLNRNEEWSFN